MNDYVKSYVGDGKAQKKFANDYLEKRSRWKNALKSGGKYEDDLTTPAVALSPGDGDFQVRVFSFLVIRIQVKAILCYFLPLDFSIQPLSNVTLI